MGDGSETTGGAFWFNVNTKQVASGPQSDWTQLLGPYATRDDKITIGPQFRRVAEAALRD